jgi:NUMOD1 domain/NUMOD3 motif
MVYKALLKYGYSNFSIEILEYCDPQNIIKREQYYIDLLYPEYNILKTAASSLGHKHSQETLRKMSNSQKAIDRSGINNPRFGKKKPEGAGAGKPFQKIAVLDLKTNLRTEYDSIAAAAEAIGIKKSRISVYLFNN